MKKILLFFILLIPGLVSAKEVNIQKVDTGIEVTKHNPTGRTVTTSLEYLYLDGKISYCVEPGVASSDDVYYSSEDFSSYMSEEKKKRLSLIHYYGYEMNPTLEYYMASQALIWEEMGAIDIVFRQQGQIISVDDLKKQIINKVNHHDDLPEYANQTYYRYVGEMFYLENYDPRYVSREYKDEHYSYLSYTERTKVFSFTQKCDEGVSLLYTNGNLQKIASFYLTEEQKKSFNVTVIYYEKKGNIEIKKTGDKVVGIKNQEISVEEKSLQNIVYGIYANEDIYIKSGARKYRKDGLVQRLVTSGEVSKSKDLYYGNYYVKEIEAPEDYIVDDQKYEFTIDDDHKKIEFTFHNERKYSKIIIQKEGEKLDKIESLKGSYTMESLDGIPFSLYTKDDIYEDGKVIILKDTLICQKKTENGRITFDHLILGNYYVVEEELPQYELVGRKDITLSENEEVITIQNQKKKGNLTIIKVNEEGHSLKGVAFQIYKDHQLLTEEVTDQNGQIIIQDLELGIYQIKEVKTLDGYQIEDIDYEVEIREKETAKIEIMNKKYIMPITSDINTYQILSGCSICFIGIINYVLEKIF